MTLDVHYSTKRPDWETPDCILERLGPIALDPCTKYYNPTNANVYCVASQAEVEELARNATTADMFGQCFIDGLAQPWRRFSMGGLVYCNPPYGRGVGKWLEKGLDGCEVIYLLPARTDTKWFHRYSQEFDVGCLINGRLKFKGAKTSAPFPSMLLYRGWRPLWFVDQFADMGVMIGDHDLGDD